MSLGWPFRANTIIYSAFHLTQPGRIFTVPLLEISLLTTAVELNFLHFPINAPFSLPLAKWNLVLPTATCSSLCPLAPLTLPLTCAGPHCHHRPMPKGYVCSLAHKNFANISRLFSPYPLSSNIYVCTINPGREKSEIY